MEDLLVSSNQPPSETQLRRAVERVLAERLPPGWSLQATRSGPDRLDPIDMFMEVADPDGQSIQFAVAIKRTIDPRLIPDATTRIRSLLADAKSNAQPVIGAAYLSPRSRQLLDGFGIGYIDTTGNVRVEASSPGLFISTQGSDIDPWPQPSNLQSLRGRGAAQAMRAIVDSTPPFGVRQLAATSRASAPTISRVLELLDREGLITRQPRGPVLGLDWQRAIRRWAEDYDQLRSNTALTFLDPRGLDSVTRKLIDGSLNYAATGAYATQWFDPIAPARTASLYVNDIAEAADSLGLRQVDAGANVVLLEPCTPAAFDRSLVRDGLRCVAPTQLAVDLLTGPGREPSQGEEILRWMKENEDVWRS